MRGQDKTPGEFRKLQVAIGSDERFVPPPPSEVLPQLHELEKYLHREPRLYDPLVDCFIVHYQFETIHPFRDGNGRVGRLLLAIMLQRLCGLNKPWLYLSQYFERFNDEYVSGLFEVSTKNDWSKWLAYCLRGVIAQADNTIQRCEQLVQLREQFLNTLAKIRGSNRLQPLVESLFESPIVDIPSIAARFRVQYQTAQKDVERLVSIKILKEYPASYPRMFYAPEVQTVAYADLEQKPSSKQ